METRPELILLQKSMVIVEGVARSLDPSLNVWTASEPVAREWVEANLGPLGRLREAGAGAQTLGEIILKTPGLLEQAHSAALGFSQMARSGLRLDDETISKIAKEQAKEQQRGSLLRFAISLGTIFVLWWLMLHFFWPMMR